LQVKAQLLYVRLVDGDSLIGVVTQVRHPDCLLRRPIVHDRDIIIFIYIHVKQPNGENVLSLANKVEAN
jgi:hypothetical protein